MSGRDPLAGLDADLRRLVRRAVDQGWTVALRKKGIVLHSPDGVTRVTIHTSHSDWRALRNVKAALRRGGMTDE